MSWQSQHSFHTGSHAVRFRDEDLADRWIKESAVWMEQNQSHPFFLFFSSHDLHVPRMPHEQFQGKTNSDFEATRLSSWTGASASY